MRRLKHRRDSSLAKNATAWRAIRQHFSKKLSADILMKIECDTHIQYGGLFLVENCLFTCKYKLLSITYWEFCRRGDLNEFFISLLGRIMRC